MGRQLNPAEPLRPLDASHGSGGDSAAHRRSAPRHRRYLRAGLRLVFESFAALGCAYLGELQPPALARLQAARRAKAAELDRRPAGRPLTDDERHWQAELGR